MRALLIEDDLIDAEALHRVTATADTGTLVEVTPTRPMTWDRLSELTGGRL